MTGETVARGRVLVRPIETEETVPGGRVIHVAETRERMTAWQCEAIRVGAPEVCDDEDCERVHAGTTYLDPDTGVEMPDVRVHPCPVRPGDWLVVRPRSYVAGPELTRAEWYVRHDDVLAILREEDGDVERDT